jgi:RNA polymerase sigma-B factor
MCRILTDMSTAEHLAAGQDSAPNLPPCSEIAEKMISVYQQAAEAILHDSPEKYAVWVESLELPGAVLSEIASRMVKLEEAASLERLVGNLQTAELLERRAAPMLVSLYGAHLSTGFHAAVAAKEAGHPTPLESLIEDANGLTFQWVANHYRQPESTENTLPATETDAHSVILSGLSIIVTSGPAPTHKPTKQKHEEYTVKYSDAWVEAEAVRTLPRDGETGKPISADLEEWKIYVDYALNQSPDALEKIVILQSRTVEYFAKLENKNRAPHEELVQEGMVELVRAARRFDYEQGVQFSTFISRSVSGALKRYFRDRGSLVRPTRAYLDAWPSISDARRLLSAQLNREPTHEEISEVLGLEVKFIEEAFIATASRKHLGIAAEDDDSDGQTSNTVRGDLFVSDEDVADQVVQHSDLAAAMHVLTENEQIAIRMRFFEDKNQQEIAEELGFSQSFVSRVLRAALTKLRDEMEGTHSTN